MRWILLVLVAVGASAAPTAAADREGETSFRIIVALSNPLDSIERERLARIFMKSEARWENGREIAAVDQSGRSDVRREFSRHVMRAVGLSRMSAVERYWQQQIFSGRGTPPPIKASDAEVVAFVAGNPAAIGYVAADAKMDGVKVVEVTGGDDK